MSELILNQTATPATPAANKAKIYYGTSKRPKVIDESGVHFELGLNAPAALIATSGAINSAETIVLQQLFAANAFAAGTTLRIRLTGTCTSSAANASNFRVRIGAAGTVADTQAVAVTPTGATTGTNVPFSIELLVTVRSAGAGGTAIGAGCLNNNGVTGVSNAAVVAAQNTATAAVNTTIANYVSVSFQAAAATTTCTFYQATIEVVKW